MIEIIISFGLITFIVYFFELANQILPPSTEALLYDPADGTDYGDIKDNDSTSDNVDRDSEDLDFNLDDFEDLLNDKYDGGLDIAEDDARDMLNKIYNGGTQNND